MIAAWFCVAALVGFVAGDLGHMVGVAAEEWLFVRRQKRAQEGTVR